MLAPYFEGATETVIIIPKKNGKTTLLGALALWHLLTVEDAACFIAAAARDQATILYDQCCGFVRRAGDLEARGQAGAADPAGRHSRARSAVGGKLRVLASDADTADGVLPTLALCDELHRHKRADFYGLFRDGLGPRDGR